MSWWKELNDFFSSTTIHGFHYIHRSQSRLTRFVWTVFVLVALAAASVFLCQTFQDWGTNYISTTIETRGVEKYPFPAVTFYPGEFTSKTGFLRTLLNHFELTRYDDWSPLYDNAVFSKKYSNFVKSFGPGSSSLFTWVKDYLLKTDDDLLKRGIFTDEVCSILALKNKNKRRYEDMQKEIINEFNKNMFKYAGYNQVLEFSTKIVNSLIEDAVNSENITSSDIDAACNGIKNEEKEEIEALLVSFLYVFVDGANVRSLGPGDIAAEDYFNRDDLHAEMTSLFNALTNASCPSSVFLFPEWFRLPRQTEVIGKDPLPSSVSTTELKTYQTFWKEFNKYEEKIAFICTMTDCNEQENFVLVKSEVHQDMMATFLKDEAKKDKVRQADLILPPCHDMSLAEQFKFNSICDFLRNISSDKAPLLKLMKFSKQSPVFNVSEHEENDIFADLESVSSQYGYFPKSMPSRPNSFISLCQFEKNPELMRLDNCNKFRRSFTNRGLGFTFNNDKIQQLYKHNKNIDLQLDSFFFNKEHDPKLTSANPDDALNVMIENNFEEISHYENTQSAANPAGDMKLKPVSTLVLGRQSSLTECFHTNYYCRWSSTTPPTQPTSGRRASRSPWASPPPSTSRPASSRQTTPASCWARLRESAE